MPASTVDGHGDEGVAVGASPERRATIGTWSRRAMDRLEDDRACWALLLAGMVVYAALALWLGRGTTLFVDEKTIFLEDRGLDASALLAPLNGHLVLLQRLLYAISFKLFGAEFLLARIVEVVGAALAVGLFFELAKRRVGAGVALAPALLLLFFGSAWELNFVVSGIGNVYAVAAGLGALLALDHPGRRSDAIACALLVVAVASFTSGLAFAVGALVLILLEPRWRRRLWVALVPLALYAAWLVWVRAVYVPEHGEAQALHAWNVLLIPNFIADEAASVAGALAGLNYDFERQGDAFAVFSTQSPYGPLLAAVAAAALVVRMWRGARSPTLYAYIAVLAAFWIAVAMGIGLGRNPTTVRYVYAGGVVALLVAAEAARGVRLSRTGLVVLYAVVALALAGNLARLRDGARYYRAFAPSLRAQLSAIELARDRVDPAFMPASGPARFDVVQAGPYLAAVDRIGSPAYLESELARQPEGRRQQADAVLVPALRIGITPARAGEALGACERPGPTFVVQPPGVAVTSPAGGRLALRRFASNATTPVGDLPPGQRVDLRIPPDRSRRPWYASVTPTAAPPTVCPLPGP
jgi:hypothetical protein